MAKEVCTISGTQSSIDSVIRFMAEVYGVKLWQEGNVLMTDGNSQEVGKILKAIESIANILGEMAGAKP